MNKFRFILSFIVLQILVGQSIVVSQVGYYEPKVPPSPNASSLGVFATIPLNLYTGTPEIKIPIYTVKNGDISFDISLQYNSLSNKVAEDASWVGLGWSLEAGGVITRIKRGGADLCQNGGGSLFSFWPVSG